MKRLLVLITIILSCLVSESLEAQNNEMFKGKAKHRHRRSWREKHNKTAYNPYVDPYTKKSKGLETKRMAKENKRVEKQAKKQIRKEKRKLRRQGKGYKKNA